MPNAKVVAIVSGGMDSVTLLYHLKDQDFPTHVVSFNYGQRHVRELECARWHASKLGMTHQIVDVPIDLPGSALTDDKIEVPEGRYDNNNMKITVVPNRNMIFLSIAAGIAISRQTHLLAIAVHNGDFAIYPDCRPEFINNFISTVRSGNRGFVDANFSVKTPFLFYSKAQIVKLGLKLKVPYDHTWSCYKGGGIACGRCGTCVERLEAFAANKVEDPIAYADRDYWKQAIKEFDFDHD